MKSSTGEHYLALDHVRALAAFMVFVWHFIHGAGGSPVSFEGVPLIFPLAVLDEGHTGVALFMTLSGYLFAKLLDGRRIHYGRFLWNRALRLLPLLLFVLVLVALLKLYKGERIDYFIEAIYKGVLYPSLPNGGWSITVEFHFYLILPLLLLLVAWRQWSPLIFVAVAIALRLYLHGVQGEVQSLAYWTLIGRIDQFVLGIVAYQYRHWLTGRHGLLGLILLAFALFYAWFDWRGGFYLNPSYPSSNIVWVVMPAIEGVAYAALIAWYDTSFRFKSAGLSAWVAKIGAYSYSIYLFHFFIVFRMAEFIHLHVMDISNIYLATLWAGLGFLLMWPIGHLSFTYIEAPFLRWRCRYFKADRGVN